MVGRSKHGLGLAPTQKLEVVLTFNYISIHVLVILRLKFQAPNGGTSVPHPIGEIPEIEGQGGRPL